MTNQTLESQERAGRILTETAEISIIVPTFNERANVPEIVRRLDACLQGIAWEVIFIDDDSPDGTAEYVREIARKDRRVRCVQRIGRRGLSSACTEGMLSSAAQFLAVMDGDCQHDERVLPKMVEILRSGEADLVVGSRYTEGGGIGNWDSGRAKMSKFATHLSRLVIKQDLSDPMSGFFALRASALNPAVRGLSNIGFKILLDLLASSPDPLRVKEVPYEFRNRHAGESKMDNQAMWDYLMLLLDKLVGHIVPVRFVAFGIVGALGLLVHFVILTFLFRAASQSFTLSQAVASIAAMVSNFSLNNALTFRDMRLKGWGWIKGLVLFILVCSVGAFANVGIASYLFSRNKMWVLAALTGIVVGAVWNYAMSAMYTWGKRKR